MIKKLKAKAKAVKEDWAAAGAALDANQARQARKAAKNPKPAGSCQQLDCRNQAGRDGVCPACWTAIFGGLV